MRKIIGLFTGVKCKQQNLHAGITRFQLKLAHFRCYIAQILCDKVQIRQCLPNGTNIVQAGTLLPCATGSSFVTGRDSPVAFKTPKVIQTNHIIHFRRSRQPTNPPGKACFLHQVPIVQGISPKLTVGRKGIRRATCNSRRIAITIQLKHRWVRPYVNRIQWNIDRYITDNFNAPFIGIATQCRPLLEEFKLEKVMKLDHIMQALTVTLKHFGNTHHETHGPVLPRSTMVFLFHGHEQRIVFQPFGIFLYKSVECLIWYKSLISQTQYFASVLIHTAIVYTTLILAPCNGIHLFLLQQVFLNQHI